MWLVILSVKGGHKAHSAHNDEQKARAWADCLSHDGPHEATVLELSVDVIEEITIAQENK